MKKEFMKTLKYGLIGLALAAPSMSAVAGNNVRTVDFNASQDTMYDKDTRSDLCFAWASKKGRGIHGETLAITHVPCTDKVEAMIKQQNSTDNVDTILKRQKSRYNHY